MDAGVAAFGVRRLHRTAHRGTRGLLRVARYSARAPVVESRLRYNAERAEVELVADRADGTLRRGAPDVGAGVPGAVGGSRAEALRGAGALRGGVRDAAAGVVAAAQHRAGACARRCGRDGGDGRWLLRLVFRVDVEVCARCGGVARIIGFVTAPQVIRRILAHLERHGVDARAGPWAGVAAAPD